MKSIGASLLLLLFLRNPYRGRCIFTVCLGGGTYLTARLPPINEVIPPDISRIARRVRLFIDGAYCHAIPAFFVKHFAYALT